MESATQWIYHLVERYPPVQLMTSQLKCPACRQELCFPEPSECQEDVLEAVCNRCRYKYGLVHAKVRAFYSHAEAVYSSRYSKRPRQRRFYQLRLVQADETLMPLQFWTEGPEEKLSALPGDEFLLLYLIQGQKPKELIWAQNATTRRSCLLTAPGARARRAGLGTAAVTFASGILIATFNHFPTNQIFWATEIPISVGAGLFITKRREPKIRDENELKRLNSEQQLLQQKYDLEQRQQALRQELEANRRMSERLAGLRSKMNAEPEQYTTRIETVSKGITLLEQQVELAQNLLAGYAQIINILAIEYETSRLAEQLPNDITNQVLRKLEELKVIETKKEELSLLTNPQKLLNMY
ncbi:MAG: hypothetical protein JO235_10445 [Chroococcidiopsidaceae cyanobacterium CP_BM_RX_35]|nr:hypothetical protein [Chroococcidiopsidaceae cyanobacterium CP_BM_RX_35]